MQAPKFLPAIAHRAGISDELALKLWRRAVGEAARITGTTEGSDFHACSIDHFLDLVARESPQGVDFRPSRLSWFWRYHKRMADLGFDAVENTHRYWRDQWEALTRKAA